jgi:hypothetical protein
MLRSSACALLVGAASAFHVASPVVVWQGLSSRGGASRFGASDALLGRSVLTKTTAVSSTLDIPSSCDPKLRRRRFAVAAVVLAAGVAEPGDSKAEQVEHDPFPGTSVKRLQAITERVLSLPQNELDGPWPEVRRRLLWAGGLREMPSTSHAFNDWNHCDLTPMSDSVKDESNADGQVAGISRQNMLGPSIRSASLPEVGPGGRSVPFRISPFECLRPFHRACSGLALTARFDASPNSWSTCILGANQEPPRDVAHVQFQSRIAFKLVWAPPTFSSFVLVDDAGKLLAHGTPKEGSGLPSLQQRQKNFEVVRGGRYATEAEKFGKA